MKEVEEWRDVKGYEGLYQVSNLGRIKSLFSWDVNKKKYVTGGKILKDRDNGTGYRCVTIQYKNKVKVFYVHRLVAEAFCEKKDGANVVNHKDYDRSNNNANNLEWCTTIENVDWSKRNMHGLKICTNTITGEHHISRTPYGRYVVTIRSKVQGRFLTLQEAIKCRDERLEEMK